MLPLVVQARGTQVLHASAVAGRNGVIAMCGLSGVGKSTLAARLVERGLRAVADDAVPYTVEGNQVLTHSLPFVLRPRGLPPAPLHVPPAEKQRLQAIVILRPHATGDPVLTAMRPAAALGALMPHAYCFSLDEGKQELVSSYSRLVSLLTVYTLQYPHDPSAVGSTADVLEELVS